MDRKKEKNEDPKDPRPSSPFKAPKLVRPKPSKTRERGGSIEVIDLHDKGRRSLDLVDVREVPPYRSKTTTPGPRSYTPSRRSMENSGRSSMDGRRISTSSRISEDRRLLPRRVMSIDTTCVGAAPDGSGRPSKSIDLTAEELADQWTATIVASFDLCGQVRYILQVRAPPRKWLIRRSFKDFERLDQSLRKRFGSAGLPTLPPRSHNLFGPSPEFLEKRQKGLQLYIDTVSASRGMLRNCRLCRDFIQPPKISDRTTFLLNPNTPPLPTDFPDLPAEDLWPKAKVPIEMRHAISELVNKAAVSLRRLYMFEQTLETDKALERQSITFDQERANVAKSLHELQEFMPQLESLCHDQIIGGWKELVEFVNECARVCGQAISWARSFDAEEAAVIRKFVRVRDSIPIRPVEFYEERAATMASEMKDFAAVMLQSHPPVYVAELFSQIEREMEIRSDAVQACSVNRLHRLLEMLKSGRSLKKVSDTERETPLQTIIDALLKRSAFLDHSVYSFVSNPDYTGIDRTGLLYQIEQLANDIDEATSRVERLIDHCDDPEDSDEEKEKKKPDREEKDTDEDEDIEDDDEDEKEEKEKKEKKDKPVSGHESGKLSLSELQEMDDTLVGLDTLVGKMLETLENAPDNGAADRVTSYSPVIYDEKSVEMQDFSEPPDYEIVDVIPERV